MFKRNLIAVAIAFGYAGVAPAQDSELAKIREEIKQMKQTYERRIDTLEKRLADAEVKVGRAEQSATKAESAASSTTAGVSNRSGESAFPTRPFNESKFAPCVTSASSSLPESRAERSDRRR